MSESHSEIQAFLKRHIGRCENCGHGLKEIAAVHRKHQDGSIMYDSGLTLVPTHWNITEVDYGEPTGVGCTKCEEMGGYCDVN